MKKLTTIILTITAIIGVCLCMTGAHSDLETQLIMNTSGVIILCVSLKLCKIIEGKNES